MPGAVCAKHPQGRSGKRFLAPFPLEEILAPVSSDLEAVESRLRDWAGGSRVPAAALGTG